MKAITSVAVDDIVGGGDERQITQVGARSEGIVGANFAIEHLIQRDPAIVGRVMVEFPVEIDQAKLHGLVKRHEAVVHFQQAFAHQGVQELAVGCRRGEGSPPDSCDLKMKRRPLAKQKEVLVEQHEGGYSKERKRKTNAANGMMLICIPSFQRIRGFL